MTRVLVVHADPATAHAVGEALDTAGMQTHRVGSGEGAMDQFIQEPADVVVVDYALSGRDGIATAEAIRWMPGGRRARIILTSDREPEDSTLAELGARVDAFAALVGPLDIGRVRAMTEAAALVRTAEGETRVLSPEMARAVRAFDDRTAPTRELELPADLVVPLSGLAASPVDDEPATLDQPMPSLELVDADGEEEGQAVRDAARAASTTHSDVFGTFEKMSFAQVLHRLAERRAHGALVCVHPADGRPTVGSERPTKVVYYRAGVPVHVRSNLVVECLGHVLSQQRKIGPDALRESLEAMRRGEGRQGELLVSMGAIQPAELSEALVTQMRIKLFELFGWNDGTFRFSTELAPPPELIELEMGLAEIVLSGTRVSVPASRALALLEPRRHTYAIPHARALVRFVQLKLEPSLRALVHQADGSRTVGALLDEAPDPGAAAQLLRAMECLDAVRFEAAPSRAVVVQRQPQPRALPPVPDAVVSVARVRDGLVSDDAMRLEEQGPPEEEAPRGGQARDALPETVERPLEDEDLRHSTRPPPSRRTRPTDRPPRRSSAAPDPAPRAAPVPSNAVPLGAAPSNAAPLNAGPPHPMSALDAPPLSSQPVSGGAVAPRSGTPLSSSPGPSASGDADVEPPPSEESAPVSKTPPPPSKEVLDDRVQKLLRAERHARRAQRALAKDQPEDALTAIERALALCPEEGEFVAVAAWARHLAHPENPSTLDEALTQSGTACELAPKRVSVQLTRARLLTAAGRTDEAADSYRRVLELDPGHDEAHRALPTG
ncbi:MAG: DUF4388 domain-containing protein [Sandaracinaceae bacterium]